MKKVSYPAKKILNRVKPNSNVVFLGSYEDDILEAIADENYNPLQQIGITEDSALNIISKAVKLYQQGQSRERSNIPYLRDIILKELGTNDPAIRSQVVKILLFLESVTAFKYPVLAAYMSPKGVSFEDRWEAVKTSSKNVSDAVQDKVQHVATETARDAGKLVSQGVNAIDENLPWYLKTKVIIPVAIGGIALVYLSPILKALGGAGRKYRKNPAKKKTLGRVL